MCKIDNTAEATITRCGLAACLPAWPVHIGRVLQICFQLVLGIIGFLWGPNLGDLKGLSGEWFLRKLCARTVLVRLVVFEGNLGFALINAETCGRTPFGNA